MFNPFCTQASPETTSSARRSKYCLLRPVPFVKTQGDSFAMYSGSWERTRGSPARNVQLLPPGLMPGQPEPGTPSVAMLLQR